MPSPTELPIVHINNYLWALAKGNIPSPFTASYVQCVSASGTTASYFNTDLLTTASCVSTSTIPVYELDAWKTATNVWDTESFIFQPFYPVTENLAPDSAQLPYILYDYIFIPKQGTFWPMQKEEADYIIVGDIPQIYYLKNWIVEALERYDESARNINNYLISASTSVRFKYITVDQDNYIADEKRIDSFLPKFITCLKLTYEYTK